MLYLVKTTCTEPGWRTRTKKQAFLSKRAAQRNRAFKWSGRDAVIVKTITAYVPKED